MDALAITFSSIILLTRSTNAVPPSACFANFRWEDCGRDPEPKMYYWKPGSRCEVGIWRGCLPSLNMFKDEYECVSTCVFSVRAQPSDYHNKQALNGDYEEGDNSGEMTTVDDMEMSTLFANTTGPEGDVTDDNANNTNVEDRTTLSVDSGDTTDDSNKSNEDGNSDTPEDATTDSSDGIETTAVLSED
ncbi:unnamed protein product [Arctia plantaginis]|uniref:BPTI/Kunitz inhibitor domain-containing protein n=1 Tax=Arctia plantaginis TaxID=874455 RepID=A0A8S1AVH9_ARCPL|nr:unnamed protein product [Arctia plantaginis]